MRTISLIYLNVVLVFASVTASAQIKFPVNQPTPKIGEMAKFRTIDLWNGTEASRSENELIEISADTLAVKVTSSDRAEPRTLNFNKSWNPCRSLQNSSNVVCTGILRFPLEVGAKYEYKDLPWTDGVGVTSMKCEIKGEEQITIAAGNFDTVRIDCSGFWTRKIGGIETGQTAEVIWYSPVLGRTIKSLFNTTNSKGLPYQKLETQMTAFTPAR